MKDELLRIVDEEIEPPFNQALKDLVRPYIRIHTEKSPDGNLKSGSSRIGGFPDSPEGAAWPSSKDGAEPMQFLAQFDLTEIAALDEEGLMPKRGLLQFFIHHHECMVFHYPESGAGWVRLAPPPPEIKKKSFLSNLFGSKPAGLSFEPCSIRLAKEFSVPSWDSIYFDMITKDQPGDPEPFDLPEEFLERGAELRNAGDNQTNHHFLGYTDGIQNSYKEMDVADPLEPGMKSDSKERLRQLAEWILLLQIDTDGNTGMMWGDAGRLYFMIRRADLLKGDFSQVRLTMDCY